MLFNFSIFFQEIALSGPEKDYRYDPDDRMMEDEVNLSPSDDDARNVNKEPELPICATAEPSEILSSQTSSSLNDQKIQHFMTTVYDNELPGAGRDRNIGNVIGIPFL